MPRPHRHQAAGWPLLLLVPWLLVRRLKTSRAAMAHGSGGDAGQPSMHGMYRGSPKRDRKRPSLEDRAGGRGVSEVRRSPQPASHCTWICVPPSSLHAKGEVPQCSWASPAAAAAPQRPFAGRGARPRTRQLRAATGTHGHPRAPTGTHGHPRAPTGTHGHPRTPTGPHTHLLSAATVPASSNRQSWRLRASSRALGPGSCFQSSRSPLLRAMGAAGRGEEGTGVPLEGLAKEPPSRRAHGAALGAAGSPSGAAPGARSRLWPLLPGTRARRAAVPRCSSPGTSAGLRVPPLRGRGAQRRGSGAAPAGGPAAASSSSGSPGCGRRGRSDLPPCSPPFSSHPR